MQLVSPAVLSGQLYLRATYGRYKALQGENSVGFMIDWIAAPVGVEETELADFYGKAGCGMSDRARTAFSPAGISCQKDRSQEISGAVRKRVTAAAAGRDPPAPKHVLLACSRFASLCN
ncbi:WSC domain protein [Aspergillus luchuensis]|uniref:WSC domain protein n=1 Tax=Aspergillus kawachii TaxID=1069201 RepID=A0A146F3H7_ASPKA|nr:WSC domain protein [Aspergillus luchuensis]